jgi:hypothetical protein
VVPLVFKTSLGVVRSPEGSTPSLLRQKFFRRRLSQHASRKKVTPPGFYFAIARFFDG